MKPLQTAIVVIIAMLVGAAITYWAVRQLPPAGRPAPSTTPPPGGMTTQLPPPVAGDSTTPPAVEAAELDEAALDAAIAEAKAARARGELKPAATTPEGYARELGSFNWRLVELVSEFPERPEEGTTEAKTYDERIDKLTRQFANLSLDEGLLAGTRDDTPEQLAHLQAHLAGGSLELDEAGVARVEEALKQAYLKVFPLDQNDAASEAKLDAATKEVTRAISQFLTAEQQKRFDLMGVDKVFFGLPEQ